MVWCPMILAQYVIVRRIVGRAPDPAARARDDPPLRGHAHARRRLGPAPRGRGHVFVTTLVYVALRLLGVPADDPLTAEARALAPRAAGRRPRDPDLGQALARDARPLRLRGINPVPARALPPARLAAGPPARYYCHTRYIYLGIAYLYGRRFRPRSARSRTSCAASSTSALRAHRLRRASPRRLARPISSARPAWLRAGSPTLLARLRDGSRPRRCGGARSSAASSASSTSSGRAGTRRSRRSTACSTASRSARTTRRIPSSSRASPGWRPGAGRTRGGHPLRRRALARLGHRVQRAALLGDPSAPRRADALRPRLWLPRDRADHGGAARRRGRDRRPDPRAAGASPTARTAGR